MASRSSGAIRARGCSPALICSSRSALSLTLSTGPSAPATSTGSGRLSIAACEACCAWSNSPSELLRYSRSLSAMVSSSRPTWAISSSPSMRARACRSPSPIRRTARLSTPSGLSARRVSDTEDVVPRQSPKAPALEQWDPGVKSVTQLAGDGTHLVEQRSDLLHRP